MSPYNQEILGGTRSTLSPLKFPLGCNKTQDHEVPRDLLREKGQGVRTVSSWNQILLLSNKGDGDDGGGDNFPPRYSGTAEREGEAPLLLLVLLLPFRWEKCSPVFSGHGYGGREAPE